MKPLSTLLNALFILIIPVFILTSAVRILFNPALLPIVYSIPDFPADPYGFSQADRLKWSAISLDFLLNNQDLSYFDPYKLPDGTPLYNQRELSHMWDVKTLLQRTIEVWAILGIVILLGGVVAWQLKKLRSYFALLSRGGWATVIIIFVILVGVALSFNWLFTEFHRIFFIGDTWLFYYSDTFIRLFPMEFWQIAFIAGGILAILLGLLAGFGARAISKNRE